MRVSIRSILALLATILLTLGCGGRTTPADAGPDGSDDGADYSAGDAFDGVLVHLLPNSHIDAAWLWRWPETIQVIQRTWTHMADVMEAYPQVTFMAGNAAYYDSVLKQDPALFARIQALVGAGRWDVVGGHWVEHYEAHSNSESLVRQYLYGKRFYKEKLGLDVKTEFIAEGTLFSPALPQLYAGVGITHFLAGRNDDWVPGYWEPIVKLVGPEGTELPTALIQHYWQPTDPQEMLSRVRHTSSLFPLKTLHYTFGNGDHGLGPLDQELLNVDSAVRNPPAPDVRFLWSTANRYFHAVDNSGYQPATVDRFDRENARGARMAAGSSLTWVETKAANRMSENLLFAAELYAELARRLYATVYPQQTFEENWKRVLFNQFHDLSWAAGVYETIVDELNDFGIVEQEVGQALQSALQAIADHADTSAHAGAPFVLFNPAPFVRSDVTSFQLDLPGTPAAVAVADATGAVVPAQVISRLDQADHTTFQVAARLDQVPASGFKIIWVEGAATARTFPSALSAGTDFADNGFLHLQIDPANGCIASLREKLTGRELLSPGGCAGRLQVMASGGDQWAFKQGFSEKDLVAETGPSLPPDRVSTLAGGPLLAGFEFHWLAINGGESVEITERLFLVDGLPALFFDMDIDWQIQSGASLWAAFDTTLADPVTVVGDESLGIQTFFNVPAGAPLVDFLMQRFADASDGTAGLALLSDSRYLFHFYQGTLKLGLVRSCVQNQTPDYVWDQSHPYGDPPAFTDGGRHRLTFALYPHPGGWKEAEVERAGFAFNHRVLAFPAAPHTGDLGAEAGFFSVEPPPVLVSTVKKAEDNGDTVVRVFNLLNEPVTALVHLPVAAASMDTCDLLEWNFKPSSGSGKDLSVPLGPYEIRTVRLHFP